MKTRLISVWLVIFIAVFMLAYSELAANEQIKTVIGPRNVNLADGADALLAGDGEKGVRLTLQGLAFAQGDRERKIAFSNLCAGYLMMDKPLTALPHCDEALAIDPNFWRAYNNRALVYLRLNRLEESEADIARGQELRPSSEKLKIAKGMLLDETDPVIENIEIDERRQPPDEGKGVDEQQ